MLPVTMKRMEPSPAAIAAIIGTIGTLDVQKDFSDLCSLLNAKSVDYLIVGGYAVAFHGLTFYWRSFTQHNVLMLR